MTDDATIRTDAWEAKLSAEQRDRIFERLLQKFDPAKLAEWIEKEFQAPPPSRSALYRFRDRWRKDYEIRRNARVLLACQTTESLIAQEGAVSDATRAQARTLALDAALRGDFESGQRWAALAARITSERGGMVELDLKIKAETRASDELALQREKMEVQTCEKFLAWFANAKAREIAESNSTNADKIAAMRREFYSDVDAMEKAGEVKLPQ